MFCDAVRYYYSRIKMNEFNRSTAYFCLRATTMILCRKFFNQDFETDILFLVVNKKPGFSVSRSVQVFQRTRFILVTHSLKSSM